jgi:hypothetical protein
LPAAEVPLFTVAHSLTVVKSPISAVVISLLNLRCEEEVGGQVFDGADGDGVVAFEELDVGVAFVEDGHAADRAVVEADAEGVHAVDGAVLGVEHEALLHDAVREGMGRLGRGEGEGEGEGGEREGQGAGVGRHRGLPWWQPEGGLFVNTVPLQSQQIINVRMVPARRAVKRHRRGERRIDCGRGPTPVCGVGCFAERRLPSQSRMTAVRWLLRAKR